MSTPGSQAAPSPFIVFETLNAYQRTAALRAGIELKLFTVIGSGAKSAAAIAAQIGASEKGIRVLCDYLTVIDFLTKEGSEYGLTRDSELFLDQRSPTYMGGISAFLLSPTLTKPYEDLAAIVRKGGTTMDGQGTVEPDHPVWREFARSMAPIMTMAGELIAQKLGAPSAGAWKVLDIAAGHGLFGISIARHNPAAQIHALDWSKVLDVATENAQAAGVGARHHRLEGDAFAVDFGDGYDVILLTNFLHHFDIPSCETLMKKVYAALKPGGRCATLEFVPNDDRVSPPGEATFSLLMLTGTAAGDAYTFRELESMAAKAGFQRSEIHEMSPVPQHLVISYK